MNILLLPFKSFQFILIGILFSNTISAQWTAQLSTEKRGAAQSFVIDDLLYISGGYVGFTAGYVTETKSFNPENENWKKLASPDVQNRSAGIGFSINGKGYIGLGQKNYKSFSPSPEDLLDLNEYNPKTNEWKVVAEFPGAGRTHAAVFVLNNKAYVIGGELANDAGTTDEVWEYNPKTDTWTQKANLPKSAAFSSTFTSDSLGYVIGGIDNSGAALKLNYSYNPLVDMWTERSKLPKINQGGTAFSLNGFGYYGLGSNKALGEKNSEFLNQFFKYDFIEDTWTESDYTWTGEGRLWPISGVVNGTVLVGTGYKYVSGEYAYGDMYKLDPTSTAIGTNEATTISVYPNPTSSTLYIDGLNSESQIRFYDMSGRMVLEASMKPDGLVNTEMLKVGVYQIIIEVEGVPISSKVNIIR